MQLKLPKGFGALLLLLAACAPPLPNTATVPDPLPAVSPAPVAAAEPHVATQVPPIAVLPETPSAAPVETAPPASAGELPHAEPAPSPPSAANPAPPAPPAEQGYESRATYYAKYFDGRRTITGEVYDPNKMTAATNDLPLGTLVRVINPKNGRAVIVRVNDRPRKRSYPLIDLSRAAAKQLGFYGQGLIRVRVIPLPPDAPEYATLKEKTRKKK